MNFLEAIKTIGKPTKKKKIEKWIEQESRYSKRERTEILCYLLYKLSDDYLYFIYCLRERAELLRTFKDQIYNLNPTQEVFELLEQASPVVNDLVELQNKIDYIVDEIGSKKRY